MKLETYLAQAAVKQKDFAEEIGDGPHNINRYCRGHRIPKPPVMRKIYAATGGLVDANSFYDLPSLTPTGSAAVASAVGSDPSEGENAALSKASCCRPSVDDSDEPEGKSNDQKS